MFQSQTRSRSTCDHLSKLCWPYAYLVSISDEKPLHMRRPGSRPREASLRSFNLRREAAPHATSTTSAGLMPDVRVSISDEKPLHMRHGSLFRSSLDSSMFQSQTRSRSTCDNVYPFAFLQHGGVSISDEKPLHMRRDCRKGR